MSLAEPMVATADATVRRFAVAWRNRITRRTHRVGVLDYDQGTFRFRYLPGLAAATDGFRPFIGFPELNTPYVSDRLWPFFDLRVMDSKRPDFEQYVGWLGLVPPVDRLDVPARSGGEQKGDAVSLTESPTVDAFGRTSATVLVRGASYATRLYDSADTAGRLAPGARLRITDDPDNEANPDALLLTAPSGAPVGWVPDLLIDYARQLRARGGSVTVLQNNGPQAPWHVRLLVDMSGEVLPGSRPFWGDNWLPHNA